MANRRVTIEAVLVDLVTNPLGTISRGFTGFGRLLEGVGSKLNPLTSGISTLVTGFVSLSAANRAIAAAEESVQAEARLARALQGRADAIKAVNDEAAKIQSTIGTSDDVLKGVAANLVNAGVAAADLPRFLSTAAGIARELNVPIEQVAKSLANLDAETTEGPLGRILPQLKLLKEEGKSGAEIIEFLAQRFGDLDATEVTVFERIRAQQEALGDESERVGLVLADVKAKALDILLAGARALADVVSSPEFKAFLEILLQYAPAAAKAVAAFAGFLAAKAALSALLAPLGLVLSLLGSIFALLGTPVVGPFIALAGVVAGIAAALGKFEGLVKAAGNAARSTGSAFGDSFGRIGEAFDELKAGRITTADFFDFVRSEVKILGLELHSELFAPVGAFFAESLKSAGALVAALNPVEAGKRVGDRITQALGIPLSPDVAEQRAREEREAADAGSFLDRIAKASLEARRKNDAEIAALRARQSAALAADVDAGVEREREGAEKEISIAREKYDRLLADLAAARARAERAGSATGALLDVERGRELTLEAVRGILSAVSEAEREAVSEALSKRVAEDLEAQKIGLAEFTAFREAIEGESSRRRVAEAERALDVQRERQAEIEEEARSVEAILALRREELSALSAARVDPDATSAALAEVAHLRENSASIPVEFDVVLAVQDELDALDRAIREKDLGKGLADSIAEGLAGIGERVDLGVVTRENVSDVTAMIRGLEEAVRAAEGIGPPFAKAGVAAEDIAAKTGEIASLEEKRRSTLAALLDAVNREADAQKNLADIAASRSDSEARLREDREKAVEALAKEAEAAAKALPETLSGIETLQLRPDGLDADEALRAQNAAIDEVLRKIEFARGEAATLFRIDPTFGDELADISTRLDRAAESARGLALTFEEIEERQAKAVRATFITAEQVESELSSELTRIKTLEIEGILSRDVANARAERTIDSTLVALRQAKAAIEEAVREQPSLADKFARDIERIEDAIARVQAIKDDDFFAGLKAGAKGAASEFDSLAASGAQLGGSLVTSLGDGLVDVFVRGEQSFQEFLANFLEGVSVMIARMLVLSAISAAIGGGGGVFGGLLANKGGLVPGFNKGGLVRRVQSGDDDDPAPEGPTRRVLRFGAGGLVPALRTAAATLLMAGAAAAATPVLRLNEGGPVLSVPAIVSRAATALRLAGAGEPIRLAAGGRAAGLVPGARTHRDDIDAKLTAGEFVQPEPTVEAYGVDLMEAFRKRTIPPSAARSLLHSTERVVRDEDRQRFESGGAVSPVPFGGRGSGSSSGREGVAGSPFGTGRSRADVTFPIIVSDKQAMDRLLAGALWPEIQDQMNRDQSNTRGALFGGEGD